MTYDLDIDGNSQHFYDVAYYTIMDSWGGKDGLILTKQTNIDQDNT